MIVSIEVPGGLSTSEAKENIENCFPGWKVKWVTFISDFEEKQILSEIVVSRDPGLLDVFKP